MGRAEFRRAAKAQAKPKPQYSIYVGQNQINKVKRELTDEVAVPAYQKGYDDGYAAGRQEATLDYCGLLYPLFGLALDKFYGFKARRIYKVFSQMDEWYGQIAKAIEEDRIDAEGARQRARDILDQRTGLDWRIKK